MFAGIGRSPVPVLLPFDTAGYLEDQADGTQLPLSRYQADFSRADLFHAGPAGYDAVFSLHPGAGAACRRGHSPGRSKCRSPARSSSTTSPIRSAARASRSRRWRRSSPTCAASSAKAMCATPSRASACPMWCRSSASNSAPRARRLACREAYPIAERFLKALRIAGGQPAQPRHDISSEIAERPGGGFARLHLLPGRRHHRPQQRAPARRTRRLRRLFANPFSARESPGRHPLAILRQGKSGERPRRLSVAGQFLRSPQLPGRAMRRRLRASGPGHPPRALPAEQQQRKQLAIRGSRPSSPSATAS